MRNYFNEQRWKIIRVINLLQFILCHHRIQVPKVLGARELTHAHVIKKMGSASMSVTVDVNSVGMAR